MCGIAGIVETRGQTVDRAVLTAVNAEISRRGPDGDGVYIDGGFGLAHRRLAIIDVTGGVQPMSNEDGQVWVTFNGAIYNHSQLRQDLESAGHRFRTRSDTEVIVHAYEEWGAHCVDRFRGMFAFGVYDARRREVFLARDRLGVKPLVYAVERGRFAFASELQALQKLPGIAPRLNLDALSSYLQLGYIPAPATIYQNVYKLPPGHTMVVTESGKVIGPRRYWDVQFEPDDNPTEREWAERLDAALREAVDVRLQSDVPFGAFLSGGVDSSIVVAYMAQLSPNPVRTFSIGFDEADYSELGYARQVAKRLGTDHHEEILRPDALAILPDLVRHYGEPFGDSSAIPTYYVSKLARGHVKMVLSGDGGDESFAGYHHYAGAASYRYQPKPFRDAMTGAARAVGLLPPRPLDWWLRLVSVMTPDDRRALCDGSDVPVTRIPSALRSYYSSQNHFDLCSWYQYFDLKSYLPYDILTKVDIASMYHGLEVRAPFLDHHIVELAARIPSRFKVKRNRLGGLDGKSILKQVGLRFYDHEFLHRRKMGFCVPLPQWLADANDGDLYERLLDPHSRLMDLLDKKSVQALIQRRPRDGRYYTYLWLLLFLAEWFRQHPGVSIP